MRTCTAYNNLSRSVAWNVLLFHTFYFMFNNFVNIVMKSQPADVRRFRSTLNIRKPGDWQVFKLLYIYSKINNGGL